ncbi:MAG: hypothetical protein AB7L17_19250 [Ilumatobacteraceae bacterium]
MTSADPTRPNSRSSYSDRDALGRAVRSLVHRFGVGVLHEPVRFRNLLLDEYGERGHRARSDIDSMVEAVSSLRSSSSGVTVLADEPTRDPASISTLNPDDLRWTEELLQSCSQGDIASPGTGMPPGPTMVPPPPPPPSATPAEPVEHEDRNRRYGRATVAWAVTAIVAVIAVGVLVVVAQRQSSAADRWRDRHTEVAAELDALTRQVDSESESMDGTMDDIDDERDADSATIAQQQEALAAQEATLAEQQARIDQLSADLDAANATAADLSAQLASFDLATTAIARPTTSFTGNGSITECTFTNGCPNSQTWSLWGSFLVEGAQVFLNVEDQAKVPVSTSDGLTYSGFASVTGAYGHHLCNDQRVPTTLTIVVSPSVLRVDPKTRTVLPLEYNASWTLSSDKGGSTCKDASRSYVGTISFR